jgi:hypothetical protein
MVVKTMVRAAAAANLGRNTDPVHDSVALTGGAGGFPRLNHALSGMVTQTARFREQACDERLQIKASMVKVTSLKSMASEQPR